VYYHLLLLMMMKGALVVSQSWRLAVRSREGAKTKLMGGWLDVVCVVGALHLVSSYRRSTKELSLGLNHCVRLGRA
jgi:hypothetical protein